jgi:hypothetical protein
MDHHAVKLTQPDRQRLADALRSAVRVALLLPDANQQLDVLQDVAACMRTLSQHARGPEGPAYSFGGRNVAALLVLLNKSPVTGDEQRRAKQVWHPTLHGL